MKTQFHLLSKTHNLFIDQQTEVSFLKQFENSVKQAANSQVDAPMHTLALQQILQKTTPISPCFDDHVSNKTETTMHQKPDVESIQEQIKLLRTDTVETKQPSPVFISDISNADDVFTEQIYDEPKSGRKVRLMTTDMNSFNDNETERSLKKGKTNNKGGTKNSRPTTMLDNGLSAKVSERTPSSPRKRILINSPRRDSCSSNFKVSLKSKKKKKQQRKSDVVDLLESNQSEKNQFSQPENWAGLTLERMKSQAVSSRPAKIVIVDAEVLRQDESFLLENFFDTINGFTQVEETLIGSKLKRLKPCNVDGQALFDQWHIIDSDSDSLADTDHVSQEEVEIVLSEIQSDKEAEGPEQFIDEQQQRNESCPELNITLTSSITSSDSEIFQVSNDEDDEQAIDMIDCWRSTYADEINQKFVDEHVKQIKQDAKKRNTSFDVQNNFASARKIMKSSTLHIAKAFGQQLSLKLAPKKKLANTEVAKKCEMDPLQLISDTQQLYLENRLMNEWELAKQRQKQFVVMRQNATTSTKSPFNSVALMTEQTEQMVQVQLSFQKSNGESFRNVEDTPNKNSSPQTESWTLSNSLMIDKPNSNGARNLIQKLNLECSDSQFKLMEHMLLQPVIDSKYLLKLREDVLIEEVLPAIMNHVISKMESYDLVEFELPVTSIIDDSLRSLSRATDKFVSGLRKIGNLDAKGIEAVMSTKSFYQTDVSTVQDFQDKRLTVGQITCRLHHLVDIDSFARTSTPGFEELDLILAQLQPRFFQKLWESAQTVSFLRASNRIKQQQRIKDRAFLKLQLIEDSKRRRKLRHHKGIKHTMSLTSDFSKFADLAQTSEKLPYIMDMHTYQKMKALVKTQNLNYYLLTSRSWQKSLASRLRETTLLPIMEQLLQHSRLQAMAAAFTVQRERMLQNRSQVLIADSSESDEDENQPYKRMDAWVPDPNQLIQDMMNAQAVDSVIPSSGQKVSSDLQATLHYQQIFPHWVDQWHELQIHQINKQSLLIESFTMHTKLQKLPNFEPLMEIYIPTCIQSRLVSLRRQNNTGQSDFRKQILGKEQAKQKMHKIEFSQASGTLVMTKKKIKRQASSNQLRENSGADDKNNLMRRRSDSLNSITDLAQDRKIMVDDDCSIATDGSLQELKLKDVVDFYQMLDDQTSPDVVQRQTTDHQNERFDILIQGFKTVTMEYVDNDMAKDGCEHSDSSGDSNNEQPQKQKTITDQIISQEYKIDDVLDQMVTKFNRNRVRDFVDKIELEAYEANIQERRLERRQNMPEIQSFGTDSAEDDSDSSSDDEEYKHVVRQMKKGNRSRPSLKVHPIQLVESYNQAQALKLLGPSEAETAQNIERKKSSSALTRRNKNENIMEESKTQNRMKPAEQIIDHLRTVKFDMAINEAHVAGVRSGQDDAISAQSYADQDQLSSGQFQRTSLSQSSNRKLHGLGKIGDDVESFESSRVTTPTGCIKSMDSDSEISSKFGMDDNYSQSSEDLSPVAAVKQKKKDSDEKIANHEGDIAEPITPTLPSSTPEKPKKKKVKRVRLLRQDVFKPEVIPDDMKKVICLARKTSVASRQVLEQFEIKQKKQHSSTSQNERVAREIMSTSQQSSSVYRPCKKDKCVGQMTKRIDEEILYDKQILERLICQGGSLVIVSEAIKKYPENLNLAIDDNDMNWLILAIKNGRSDIAKFLVSQRVDPNKADSDGNTALHHAFMYNFENCIQLLVDSGVDESIQNKSGVQPWELAGQL